MGLISFALVNNDSDEAIKVSTHLLDIFVYIRNTINNPVNWSVEELDGDDIIDTCSAYYLIVNYTQDNLPKSILDIPNH